MSGSQHGGAPVDHCECGKILAAGRTLIEKSHLTSYQSGTFVACTNPHVFERRVEAEFHQRFGRYMAWVWFKEVPNHPDRSDLGVVWGDVGGTAWDGCEASVTHAIRRQLGVRWGLSVPNC